MKPVISLLALAATLSACAPTEPVAVAQAAPDARFAVTDTKDYGPEEVNTIPSDAPTLKVAYGSASARQYGELRMPEGKGPFPVAVIWHGGCWSGYAGPFGVSGLATFLARNGVATWTPGYRELGSDGGWPNTFADWAQGLAYVKTLAKSYPIDLSRLTLMGHSAGTTPAVWLGTGDYGDAVIEGDLPKPRAAVVIDGPLRTAPFVGVDAAICGQPVIVPLMGGTPADVPSRYAMLDPLVNKPLIKRLLVVDGALPDPEPEVIAGLRAQGIAVEVIRVSQEQHFNMLVPGTKDFAAIGPSLLDIAKAR
jgi:acetyl esterase/lipase